MEYQGTKLKAIKSTCLDCKKRYPGCHDHCEDYQQANAEWTEYKERIRKTKRLHKEFDVFKVDGAIRRNNGK